MCNSTLPGDLRIQHGRMKLSDGFASAICTTLLIAANISFPSIALAGPGPNNWDCSPAGNLVYEREADARQRCMIDVSTTSNDYTKCTYTFDHFGSGSCPFSGSPNKCNINSQWEPIHDIGPSYCNVGGNYFLTEWYCSGTTHYWEDATAECVAGTDPDPQTHDEEFELGKCDNCQDMRGKPVNVATGNNFYIEADYRGAGPFPLTFERFYNSSAAVTPASMGSNWRHTYNRSVQVTGITSGAATSVKVFRPDGKVLKFNKSGGAWVANAVTRERLVENFSGSVRTGWTLALTDSSVEAFNKDGLLTSITNSQGLVQTLSYDLSVGNGGDGLNNTLDQIAAYNRTIRITYFSGLTGGSSYKNGKISSITDPANQTISYDYTSYSSNGLVRSVLAEVTYPGDAEHPAPTREYACFANTSRLFQAKDEAGVATIEWSYDTKGRTASEKEYADGVAVNNLTFQYNANVATDPADDTTTVADALGQVQIYEFKETLGTLQTDVVSGDKKCADCGAQFKSAVYNTDGTMQSRTDFKDVRTDYIYTTDGRGLETSRTEAANKTISEGQRTILTAWEAAPSRLVSSITEENKRTAFTYESGRVKTRTEVELDSSGDPVAGTARTTTYTYCPTGQSNCPVGLLKSIDGERADMSDVTEFAYSTDGKGNITTVTNAIGHVTTYGSYDNHGRPTSITDQNGLVTTLEYHPRGWLKKKTVGGLVTTIEYSITGNLKKVSLPDGGFVEYEYDSARRLKNVKDAVGNEIVYTLDGLGNRKEEKTYEKEAGGALMLKRNIGRVYDDFNRLDVLTGGMGQVADHGYDNNGNLTSVVVDPAGLSQVTSRTYDALNRLESTTTSPDGTVQDVTTYTYDARDNLTTVTDPEGLVTTYTYDGLDNLIELESPDTGTTTYTYDAAGNRKS